MRRPARRAAWAWAALAAAVGAGVAWRARDLRAGLEREVVENYTASTRGLVVPLSAWGQTRAAHAEAMAELLADDAALAAPEARGALQGRFARAMAALARRGTFRGGWVLDAAGRPLARVAPGAGGAGVADADAPPAAVDPDAPPAPAAGRAARAAPGARALTVPCGAEYCVAFLAPVRRAAAAPLGAVVLLAAIDDSTLRLLFPIRPHIRTARTSLVAPLAGAAGRAAGDTLVVVASVGAPGSPAPVRRRPAAAWPAHVRRARAAAPGVTAVGVGPGLHGRPTLHATARVPELDWVILRELDRAEVSSSVRRVLLVEEPILVALLVSLAVVARGRLRAGRERRAQELTRLRADFVASTSHELRTPLAQIRMFAELLQKGALRRPDETARALRVIEKEASRLTILVDNLLNYTSLRRRAEDAATVETLVPTDVADEVTHVIEAFAPLAGERGARVVSAVPAGLRARIDSLALRQVLTNYLENAVKYGPRGQTVTVGAAAAGRAVRVWVDDEGPGVPPEERDAVWTAFRRGRRAESSAQGGSGIGLAVVRELVLQYGGRVAVEGAPRGGARFVAEFPQAADDAPGARDG